MFVDEDEICLATCWFEPWDSKCYKWDTYLGAKYCKGGVDCRHDKGTKFNGGTRYASCVNELSEEHHHELKRRSGYLRISCA